MLPQKPLQKSYPHNLLPRAWDHSLNQLHKHKYFSELTVQPLLKKQDLHHHHFSEKKYKGGLSCATAVLLHLAWAKT